MTDNFVGFARSPKQSKTASLQQLQTNFDLSLPVADAVRLISTAEGVERWIGELVTPKAKWRFQLGAKLRFNDASGEFGATFGAINLPQEVILLTERFGEIRLGFGGARQRRSLFTTKKKQTPNANLDLLISRMCEPEEVAAWEAASLELSNRLGRILQPRSPVTYQDE